MRRLDVRPGYVLIVPGGGSAHSSAENAPRVVAAAARAIAERGHCTILVGLTAGGNGAPSGLRSAPLMPLDELAELIRGARLVICNGGDTLLQVIACGRPCIAVAIAGDQSHRIERCAERGLTLRSRLEESALAGAALAYLDRPAEASGASGAAGSALINAMDLALDALGALAGTEGFTRPQSAS
jgi:UDP:flavonoid glycosyltransferase YjiC (YdhE family)